jgi:hypothetical protein
MIAKARNSGENRDFHARTKVKLFALEKRVQK